MLVGILPLDTRDGKVFMEGFMDAVARVLVPKPLFIQ